MDTAVVEMAGFATRAGVSDEQLVEAAVGVGRWVSLQPGFLRRELTRTGDGRWVDVILWASMADAERAGAAIMDSIECAPMMSMIDPESVDMRHGHVVVPAAP